MSLKGVTDDYKDVVKNLETGVAKLAEIINADENTDVVDLNGNPIPNVRQTLAVLAAGTILGEHVPVATQATHPIGLGQVTEMFMRGQANKGFSQRTISRIKSLIATGELRFAILGDSTEAGVGAGGSTYGQCNSPKRSGMLGWLWPAFAAADLNFVRIHVENQPSNRLRASVDGNGAGFYPQIDLVASHFVNTDAGVLRFWCEQFGRVNEDKFTVYRLERTAAEASRFRVVIAKDSEFTQILADVQIDTWVAAENFDGNIVNVENRMVKTTITMNETPPDKIYVKIDDVTVLLRGTDIVAAPDGTAVIGGFAFGNGIEARNWAVSSTTLKNDSDINQSRGITTTERLGVSMVDNKANVLVFGGITNDSKPGASDPVTYKAELKQWVADARAILPEVEIIFTTDPAGEIGSEYENNVVFNQIVREVAFEDECALFDIERIIAGLPASVYAAGDPVHLSYEGYRAISRAFINLLGLVPANMSKIEPIWEGSTALYGKSEVVNDSNATAVMTNVFSVIVNRPSAKTCLKLLAKFQLAEYSDINSEFVMKLRGYEQYNGVGTPTAWKIVDFNKPSEAIGGNASAKDNVELKDEYFEAGKASYEIVVEGTDYNISGTGLAELVYRWMEY